MWRIQGLNKQCVGKKIVAALAQRWKQRALWDAQVERGIPKDKKRSSGCSLFFFIIVINTVSLKYCNIMLCLYRPPLVCCTPEIKQTIKGNTCKHFKSIKLVTGKDFTEYLQSHRPSLLPLRWWIPCWWCVVYGHHSEALWPPPPQSSSST